MCVCICVCMCVHMVVCGKCVSACVCACCITVFIRSYLFTIVCRDVDNHNYKLNYINRFYRQKYIQTIEISYIIVL